MMTNTCLADWDSNFQTSTKWFDAIIQIDNFRPARTKDDKSTAKGLHRIEVPGWDISKILLKKLEKSYGHLALFFAEEYDSKVIGVKFKTKKVYFKAASFSYE